MPVAFKGPPSAFSLAQARDGSGTRSRFDRRLVGKYLPISCGTLRACRASLLYGLRNWKYLDHRQFIK